MRPRVDQSSDELRTAHLRQENAAAIATVIELKNVGNLSLYFTF
jgi:hypothetical protein